VREREGERKTRRRFLFFDLPTSTSTTFLSLLFSIIDPFFSLPFSSYRLIKSLMVSVSLQGTHAKHKHSLFLFSLFSF